jgi:hypothetical protein
VPAAIVVTAADAGTAFGAGMVETQLVLAYWRLGGKTLPENQIGIASTRVCEESPGLGCEP